MKASSFRKYSFIFCCTFFHVVITACSNQGQSNRENLTVQAQNETQPIESRIDSNRLKFTSGIRSILEDSKGNIWFGSHQEGVALFDGETLTYFDTEDGLSDNQVRSIHEDEKGKIWFEGGVGLSSYDGDKITVQTERMYDAKDEGKTSESALWFKGDKANGYNALEGGPGVYAYDGEKLSYHTFPVESKAGVENYYSISTPFVRGKDGIIWFGTYGAAIGYDGSDFTIIDNDFLGLNEESGPLHIRSLMEDSKGNLWIGNNGIGVFRYDGEETVHFTKQHNLDKNNIRGNSLTRVFSIGEDGLGNVWFGTAASGVWRFDGQSLTNFTKVDGLESEHIWTIYRSKGGEMWFGGAEPSGVYRFDGDFFERKF